MIVVAYRGCGIPPYPPNNILHYKGVTMSQQQNQHQIKAITNINKEHIKGDNTPQNGVTKRRERVKKYK
jgi:hypothetical protein